ncbi:MAG: PAS domain-containing protein [Armatimonadetes bacterium]|nr:PAS domain-containing protein [Armatimonadota bacterium]
MTTENSLTPLLHGVLWNEVDAGVLLVDSHNRILESNPAAIRLLEIRERPLVGQTLLQITLSYELLSLVTKVQKSGLPDERELRITKESSPLTLHVRAVPIPNENLPSHSLIMLLLKDVSELRRLETIRRDLVANVSHELRTPLTSIRAMAETLQEGAIHDEEVAERFVLIIQQEVERLTRLLEDLLVLSHAESKPPERVQFALDEQIKKVVERLRPQAETDRTGTDKSCRQRHQIPLRKWERVLSSRVDSRRCSHTRIR